MSQEDYDKLNSILTFFKRYFSLNAKPFCKECKYYYYGSGGQCYRCKVSTDTYFGRMTPKMIRDLGDRYKGRFSKQSINEKSPKETFKQYLEKKKHESK